MFKPVDISVKSRMERMNRKLELEGNKRSREQQEFERMQTEAQVAFLAREEKMVGNTMKRGRKSIQGRKKQEVQLNNMNFCTVYKNNHDRLSPAAYAEHCGILQHQIAKMQVQYDALCQVVLNEKAAQYAEMRSVHIQLCNAKNELLELNQLYEKTQFDAPRILLDYEDTLRQLDHAGRARPKNSAAQVNCPIHFDCHLGVPQPEEGPQEDLDVAEESFDVCDDQEMEHEEEANEDAGSVHFEQEQLQLKIYQVVVAPATGMHESNSFEFHGRQWNKQTDGEHVHFYTMLQPNGDYRAENEASSATPLTSAAFAMPLLTRRMPEVKTASEPEARRKRPLTRKPPCTLRPPNSKQEQEQEQTYVVSVNPVPYHVNPSQTIVSSLRLLPRMQYGLMQPVRGRCRFVATVCGHTLQKHLPWDHLMLEMEKWGVEWCSDMLRVRSIALVYSPAELVPFISNELHLSLDTLGNDEYRQSFHCRRRFQTSSIMKTYLETINHDHQMLYHIKSSSGTGQKFEAKPWAQSSVEEQRICTTMNMNFSYRNGPSVAVLARGHNLDTSTGCQNNEKLRNWHSFLQNKQGKESQPISAQLRAELTAEIARCGYSRRTLTNQDTWRNMLRNINNGKQVKVTGWYKHIPKLMKEIAGIAPLQLSDHEEQILMTDYANLLKVFPQCRRGRHNVPFQDLCFYKLCEAHGWKHLIHHHRPMKSAKNRQDNMMMLDDMCTKIGLTIHK
jgi:hypothetical protein